MRALVTGGAGFIPSHVVDGLLDEGAEVTVLDDLSAGRLENLDARRRGWRSVRADVSDADAVTEAAAGCDVLIHMASPASVPLSVEDPPRDFRANATGMLAVLEAARRHDAKRVVLASTAAVYGTPQYTPMDEDHPTVPISPYGATKLASEHLMRAWTSTYGLEGTILRIFNSYGPRQPRYVIHDLYRKIATNPRRVEVLGTGEEIRDYTFVKDTARAFVEAATRPEMAGKTYNVSSGEAIRVRDLVDLLVERMGLAGQVRLHYRGTSWAGDIPCLHGDARRLRAIGIHPRTDLHAGLGATIAWFRENAPLEK